MVKRAALVIGILTLFSVLATLGWVTDAPAYLGHAASTCDNCHVMDDQYQGWYHAAHAHVDVVCTDCHLPHQNIASYYIYKGYSGMKDVVSFSLGLYPEAIRATAQTDRIIQDNCIRCHRDTVESIVAGAISMPFDRECWSCHRSTAHGPRGLSLYPHQDSEVYDK